MTYYEVVESQGRAKTRGKNEKNIIIFFSRRPECLQIHIIIRLSRNLMLYYICVLSVDSVSPAAVDYKPHNVRKYRFIDIIALLSVHRQVRGNAYVPFYIHKYI